MHAHGREAAGGLFYERHRPEQTQLYRLLAQPYPAFVTHLAEQGKQLPASRPLPELRRPAHGPLLSVGAGHARDSGRPSEAADGAHHHRPAAGATGASSFTPSQTSSTRNEPVAPGLA